VRSSSIYVPFILCLTVILLFAVPPPGEQLDDSDIQYMVAEPIKGVEPDSTVRLILCNESGILFTQTLYSSMDTAIVADTGYVVFSDTYTHIDFFATAADEVSVFSFDGDLWFPVLNNSWVEFDYIGIDTLWYQIASGDTIIIWVLK